MLDELLELPPAERSARLASMKTEDTALIADLEALLARESELDDQRFMTGPALQPPPDLAGQTLGPYTLERELGRGGMGQVWLARRTDGRYEGQVAIKLLQTGFLRQGGEARFEREGRILARLDQPHIARLLDAGVSPDGHQPYLVLEFVDGEHIDRYVQQRVLTVAQCLQLMIDAADAVAHAHSRLILHRDLKPSNMLVRADGQLKLLDFGIAKLLDEPGRGDAGELTRHAGAAFTPSYAAPEQLQGGEVTTATDVYALGVLLYELLGGGHPTAGTATTPLARLQAAVDRVPRPLSEQVQRAGGADAARRARALRGDIDTVVAKALKKQPAERYANAADLAEDLRRVLAHEPVAARPDSWAYRSSRFVRRHRVGVAVAGVAVGAVLAGAGVALQQAHEAQAQRAQAEGLLEFMLGDLRKRLQPVGRLDALDAVGERALAYYAAQDAADLDAESLGRRARALHLIGEIAERRGQLAAAEQRFTEAARSTAERLARAPVDGERLFDHAQSEYWVGFIARRRGDLPQAEAAMQRYVDLAERLARVAAARPDKPDWLLELPLAQQNLGVLQLEQGRSAQALVWLDKAAQALGGAAPGSPERVLGHVRALGWAARARENLGDIEGALQTQETKLVALGRLSDGVQDGSDVRYNRAVTLSEMAGLHLALGRLEKAVQTAVQAADSLQVLADRDPSNLDWVAQTGMAKLDHAQALMALGRRAEARDEVDAAERVLAPLWATDPAKLYWHIKIRGTLLVVRARVAGPTPDLQGRVAEAVAAASTAEATGRRLDLEQARVLAMLHLLQGDLAAQAGQRDPARQAWQAAVQRVALRADGGDPAAMVVLAHAKVRMGDIQAATGLSEKLDSTPYRHPLWTDLRQRLEPGKGAGSRP
jgi:serine/threonine protein kinase